MSVETFINVYSIRSPSSIFSRLQHWSPVPACRVRMEQSVLRHLTTMAFSVSVQLDLLELTVKMVRCDTKITADM